MYENLENKMLIDLLWEELDEIERAQELADIEAAMADELYDFLRGID